MDSARKSFTDLVPIFLERFGQEWRVWDERFEAVSSFEYLMRLRAYVHTKNFRDSGRLVFKMGGPFQFKIFVKTDIRKNSASAQGRHRRRHRDVSARGRQMGFWAAFLRNF